MSKSRVVGAKKYKLISVIAVALCALLYICAVMLFGGEAQKLGVMNKTASFGMQRPSPSPSPVVIDPGKEQLDANNAKSGGLIAAGGGELYFVGSGGAVMGMIRPGGETRALGFEAGRIFWREGWLYYTGARDGRIYRTNLIEGERQLLGGERVDEICAAADKIYYTASSREGIVPDQIWSMDLAGGNNELLVSLKKGGNAAARLCGVSVYRGWLYYLRYDGAGTLLRFGSGGPPREETVAKDVNDYAFYGDALVLCGFRHIMLSDLSGADARELCEINGTDAAILENRLIFSSVSDGFHIYWLDLASPGDGVRKLLSRAAACTSAADGLVFYAALPIEERGCAEYFYPDFAVGFSSMNAS